MYHVYVISAMHGFCDKQSYLFLDYPKKETIIK